MIVSNKFSLGTVALSDFSANAAIGTAAATVDKASAFLITQTTASITVTVPSPTTSQTGQVVRIMNSSTSTADLTVSGVYVRVGKYVDLMWDGATWLEEADEDSNATAKAYYTSTAIAAGTTVITHNLNLATPKSLSLTLRDDATGEDVAVYLSTYTANAVTINSAVAIATGNVFIVAK